MFVEQTHEVRHEARHNERPMRFTDTRLDEQERGVSIKMVPMSLVMQAASGKSYLCNIIDTPGARARAPRAPLFFLHRRPPCLSPRAQGWHSAGGTAPSRAHAPAALLRGPALPYASKTRAAFDHIRPGSPYTCWTKSPHRR